MSPYRSSENSADHHVKMANNHLTEHKRLGKHVGGVGSRSEEGSSATKTQFLHKQAYDAHMDASINPSSELSTKANKLSQVANEASKKFVARPSQSFSNQEESWFRSISKGKSDKSPWTMHMEVKLPSENDVAFRGGKEAAHSAYRKGSTEAELRKKVPGMKGVWHEHYIRGYEHGINNPPEKDVNKSADKSPWTMYSHAYDVKQMGKGSFTKHGKLKSSAIHELHHPRTATQTRAAIDHLASHKDSHTPGEQQALAERVRRAAKKHGVSMAGTKSPAATKKNLERKARMAQKALDMISDLLKSDRDQRASEHAAEALVDHHYYTKLGKTDLASEARRAYDGAVARGVKVTPEHIESGRKYGSKVSAKMGSTGSSQDKLHHEAHDAAVSELSRSMNKAMTAASMPRIPRALRDDTYRSATAVMIRDHSGISKDIHTGPLTPDVIEELKEEEKLRTRGPVYKSCTGCGRTFMVKGMNDPCPTCSMHKSHYCSKCNSHLIKSTSGSICPLCG